MAKEWRNQLLYKMSHAALKICWPILLETNPPRIHLASRGQTICSSLNTELHGRKIITIKKFQLCIYVTPMHLLKLNPGDNSTGKIFLKYPSTTKPMTALPTFSPTTLHYRHTLIVSCVHLKDCYFFWSFTRTSPAHSCISTCTLVLRMC